MAGRLHGDGGVGGCPQHPSSLRVPPGAVSGQEFSALDITGNSRPSWLDTASRPSGFSCDAEGRRCGAGFSQERDMELGSTRSVKPAETAERSGRWGRWNRRVPPSSCSGCRPCDNDVDMRGVVVLIVLLSLVAAPVAMAADGCFAMSSACGAPCSAPCVSTPTAAADPVILPVAGLAPATLGRIIFAALRAPDEPPKSLLPA
jgi:hypothetical protein